MQPLNCILSRPDAVIPRLLMKLAFELLPRRKCVSFGLGPSGRLRAQGAGHRPALRSHLGLLGDFQRIVDLDAQVTDGAFKSMS